MNILDRLHAADPASRDARPPSDGEVETVVTAARAAAPAGRTTPPGPLPRRLVLGTIAASAIGVVAGPSLLASRDSAFADPLRALAQDVATAPPPNADVLYAKWRTTAIESHELEDLANAVRTRTVYTTEQWHPMEPQAYKPYSLETYTATYLTPADATRSRRMSPELRRVNGLPPEGSTQGKHSKPESMCPRSLCSWTWPEGFSDAPATFGDATASFVRRLPANTKALRALIDDTPELDRFHNYNWSPRDTWNRIANWEEMRDERYSSIIVGLLQFVPTPQPVRAALIELLADVHTIVALGDRTVNGRTGLAITGFTDDPRDVIVIDRVTGLVISAQWPKLRNESTLLELAYVPAVGDRP